MRPELTKSMAVGQVLAYRKVSHTVSSLSWARAGRAGGVQLAADSLPGALK